MGVRRTGSWAANASAMSAAPVSEGRLLIVDVRHGLGNRLRAYLSARACARRAGRRLVLVWRPDEHLRVRFEELFES